MLANEAPLILPCKEPEKFNVVEHFGFTREALRENLQIEAFSEEPVIVVYNPQKMCFC